ncbi:glutathione S-transferase family protein [Amorphus coralli]|uniref:glutathione S-transferase family protein n=1 Tax=Amorphus coralli TaxID=340680 RepID=UPI00037678E4|nr:glutathione S-transferase family protein [Amorphus coralli]
MTEATSSGIIIWTFDWVPDAPRGFVRDFRLRWACEEAGLSYQVRSVPFDQRSSFHLAHQPFGQVPFMTENDVRLFESGACLLHLADKSDILMPHEASHRALTLSWVVAALNSVEMVSLPWWFVGLSQPPENPLEGWLRSRLDHIEGILGNQDWLVAERFTVADLVMADVLRLPWVRDLDTYPATHAYVERLCTRSAYRKAHADQLDHFARADATRQEPDPSGS